MEDTDPQSHLDDDYLIRPLMYCLIIALLVFVLLIFLLGIIAIVDDSSIPPSSFA